MSHDESPDRLRLDKWLWHARFFKTRSMATDAVAGGRVHVNGERTKPSHDIKVGDQLEISRDEQHFEVTVLSLPARRGPGAEAKLAYEESAASVLHREKIRDMQRYAPVAPAHRPGKHDRRLLRKLKSG